MKYAVQTKAGGKEIVLSGRITFADFNEIKAVVALFQEDSARHYVLDLSNVDFIDSSALGMFLLIRDAARSKHVGLTFKGPKGQVKRIMNLVNFPMAA